MLAIPRERICAIELCHGNEARKPFLQFFLGFMLFSLGLIGLLVTFLASAGRVSLLKIETGTVVIPLIPVFLWLMMGIGVWLLIGIFRIRYDLEITTEKGISKIFFEKTVSREEIQRFLRMAQLQFGYLIDMTILDKHSTLS